MIQTIKTPRFLVLTLLIVAAAATRALPLLVPHVWNFTAVGALAIFAGAQFSDKRLAFVMPLAAMAISDVFIGNGFSAVVYAGFVAMVACGLLINKRQSVGSIFASSVLGAVVFFLLTNFAFFYPSTLYPHNAAGILASYAAGLPFFNNMLASNLIYGAILFGSFSVLSKKYPVLAK
jgi:hypothetical protein